MTLLPEIRGQLLDAAFGPTEPETSWIGRSAVVVSLIVALVVGVAAVLLLRDHHAPAQATVTAAPVGASPEQAAIDVLAALRRPETGADLPPKLLRALRQLPPLAGSPILPLVRLATLAPWGSRLYLVPLERPTDQQVRQWVARTTGARNRTEVADSLIARVANQPAFEGVGVYPGGLSPASAVRILSGQAWTTGGTRIGNRLVNEAIVIVPDGVSRVSITVKRGGAHSTVLSSETHNNVVAFTTPEAIENLAADRITWYSSTGAILKPLSPARRTHAAARAAEHVPRALLRHYAVLRRANGTVGPSRQLPPWLTTRLLDSFLSQIGPLARAQIREIPFGDSLSPWVIPGLSGICVATEMPSHGGRLVNTHCEDTNAALSHGVFTLGQAASDGSYRLSGVVPDGNSVVTAHFRSGVTVTLPVSDNGVDASLRSQLKSVSFRNALGHDTSVPFG
jgi:hypothetical protein